MNNDLSVFLSGERLYGDDFTIDQIEEWFLDEAEGYAELGARDKAGYHYAYHQLNDLHFFQHIRGRKFPDVLGIGSAYGEEFRPISDKIDRITILDPSEAFSSVEEVCGTPCRYVRPNARGNMPFESGAFDLVTCFGVMHHIPNVSHVFGECCRCLKDGGMMLLREPIVSMGDWRKPRRGLTKRERGIPARALNEIIRKAGFTIRRRSLCGFRPIPKLANRLGIAAYDSRFLTGIDAALSQLCSRNVKYHRTKWHEKLAPSSACYILEKNVP
jgi:SAM-dependent methyltransferase